MTDFRCPIDGAPLRSATHQINADSTFVHIDGTTHGGFLDLVEKADAFRVTVQDAVRDWMAQADPANAGLIMSLPRPFGKRWGVAYALVEPASPVCGHFLNPDAPAIHLIRWCNRAASYGFRFKPGPEDDIFASLGSWNAACTEHAAIVRSHNEVAEMWSLPRRTES